MAFADHEWCSGKRTHLLQLRSMFLSLLLSLRSHREYAILPSSACATARPHLSPRSDASFTVSDLLLVDLPVVSSDPPLPNPSFPPLVHFSGQSLSFYQPQHSRHSSTSLKPYYYLCINLWAWPNLFYGSFDPIRNCFIVVGLVILAHICGCKTTFLLLILVREIIGSYSRLAVTRYNFLSSWYLFISVDVFLSSVARNSVSDHRMNFTLLDPIIKFVVNPKPMWLWWLNQECKPKINVIMVARNNEGLAFRASMSNATVEDIRICSVKSDSLQLIRANNIGSSASKDHGFSVISQFSSRASSLSFLSLSTFVVTNPIANSSLYAFVKDH